MGLLLDVRSLTTQFLTGAGTVRAVDGVSWDVNEGETVALVGESGCGKSVSALSIMRLVAAPAGRIVGGQVLFKGRDLLTLNEEEMRRVRGREIAMIFQEPMTSLNPVLTIERQLTEGLEIHLGMAAAEARRRAVELLAMVGIPDAQRRLSQYPHQFSGGMRQRMMIAMALACSPSLVLADEPTTALDVTIQAQILELLRALRQDFGMSIILITHDLGVVAEFVDEVVVMYAGQAVESAPVADIFASPAHPYTRGLLRSIPSRREAGAKRLPTIAGMVPDLAQLPIGCRFQDRCSEVFERCREEVPPLVDVARERWSRCFLSQKAAA
ncbi:MAG TPA: ABC transporter ATP-binding protein [Methylomirabilota bacterium]|nr:ABC transporter ATP-binding protein [Methylomirabilota bacterium]